jgi:hypothetical protein
MATPLHDELESALVALQAGHDTLPFLERILDARHTRLAEVPADMMELLRSSPDYTSIQPGQPAWLQLSGPPDAHAEMVVYRAETDGRHYMVAPQKN